VELAEKESKEDKLTIGFDKDKKKRSCCGK
jgi:hypothetical protein